MIISETKKSLWWKKRKNIITLGERERGTDRKEAREAIQIYLYIEEWEDDEKS